MFGNCTRPFIAGESCRSFGHYRSTRIQLLRRFYRNHGSCELFCFFHKIHNPSPRFRLKYTLKLTVHREYHRFSHMQEVTNGFLYLLPGRIGIASEVPRWKNVAPESDWQKQREAPE